MSKKSFVRLTKILLDFMFYTGIVVCVTVPLSFQYVGRYLSFVKEFYISFCVIYMLAGIFAILILWELRNMFQSVIQENPFIIRNVKSLQRMGIYAFAISVLMIIREIFIVTPAGLVLVAVFLIAGLFSMVLSQVFDQAVTYKLENDLTI